MKRCIFLGLVVLLSLAAVFPRTVARAQSEKDYEVAKRGVEDYKAGKYDDAIKDFDEAIRARPGGT